MIKFLDLKTINSDLKLKFQEKFSDFLDSGDYVLANEVCAFETEFASYCGTKYCIGVSSGLDALNLILEAYKILGLLKDGDEVLVPANTYIATVLAITNKGLNPVLIEPDLNTYNLCPTSVLKALTKNTKAILGVHLYGRLYDVKALEAISKDYNLLLIEDAAQAHGASFGDGRRAGNLSHAAAFSFYPTKNLGALGEAGAVTTNNKMLANLVSHLRNYGKVNAYQNSYKGHNNRLDELQAAFLRIKLKHLDHNNTIRRKIAKRYITEMCSKHVTLPKVEDFNQHCFHLFVVRCKDRDNFKDYLYKNGIETFVHYPIPFYKQKAYNEFNALSFPITEKIHKEVLSLPLNQILKKQEVNKVIKTVSHY